MNRSRELPRCFVWLLGAASLLFSVDATACKCARSLSLHSSGPGKTHDQGTPVIFTPNDQGTAPQLFAGDRQLDVEVRAIRSDAWCPGSLVGYSPAEKLELSETVRLVDPDEREVVMSFSEEQWEEIRKDPHFDEDRYVYEYPMEVVTPRAVSEVPIRVQVNWHRTYPWPFSEGLCGSYSSKLAPYVSQGYADIRVEPSRDTEVRRREFYVSARVALPGGEEYQEVGSSVADEAGDSRSMVSVPLTADDDTPECVFVTVYDHFLEAVFEQEMCEDPELQTPDADASALAHFTATLRELPAAEPPNLSESQKTGCSHSRRPATRSLAWLGLLLLLPVLRFARGGAGAP